MNASIFPCEAASKHSNGCMICPPGKTAIWKRPPLASSTTLAICWAARRCTSKATENAVDMRHWTFGWAMTWGTSTMAAAAAVTKVPPAATMNLRRALVTLLSSSGHELMVGAFGHVVPRANQRLEFRERRVHLPRHLALLGFLPDDLGGELLEFAQHRRRKLDDLDLVLELRPEPLEGDGILCVEVSQAVDHHGGGGVVECPPQIDRKRLVCFLVEAELGRRAGLVPAGVVVVSRGLVETENHVVVRTDVLGRIDDPSLEGGIDLARGQRDDRRARSRHDLAAETRDAHLEPLVVMDGRDLLPEPSAHLRSALARWAWHEVEGRVGFLPELEAVALIEPGRHALGVHAERDGREPLTRRLLRVPKEGSRMKRLDLALGGGVEAFERLHDLPAREDLDPEPAVACLLNDLRQLLGRMLVEDRGSPGRGHAPLDLRLRDNVRGVDDRGRGGGCHQAACRRNEPTPLAHPSRLLTPPRAGGRRPRRRGPTG